MADLTPDKPPRATHLSAAEGGAPLLDALEHRDPYPAFRALQDRYPVCWWPAREAWVLTRFSDVLRGLRWERSSVNRDERRFGHLTTAEQGAVGRLRDFYRRWPAFSDPPHHTRVRALGVEAMQNSLTEGLQRSVANTVKTIALEARRQPGPIDLVETVAHRTAIETMGLLFDLPADAVISLADLSAPVVDFIGATDRNLQRALRAQDSLDQLVNDILPLLRERKKRPGADLISQLAGLASRHNCDEDEVLALCVNLLVDGHEPIASVIATGLIEGIHQRATAEVIRTRRFCVDALRLATPFQYCGRTLLAPFQASDATISAGQRVMLMIGAANRDPRRFGPQAHIKGGSQSHLAFGMGLHRCIGAQFSTFVVSEALSSFADQLTEAEFAGSGSVVWRQSLGYRSPTRAQVTWRE